MSEQADARPRTRQLITVRPRSQVMAPGENMPTRGGEKKAPRKLEHRNTTSTSRTSSSPSTLTISSSGAVHEMAEKSSSPSWRNEIVAGIARTIGADTPSTTVKDVEKYQKRLAVEAAKHALEKSSLNGSLAERDEEINELQQQIKSNSSNVSAVRQHVAEEQKALADKRVQEISTQANESIHQIHKSATRQIQEANNNVGMYQADSLAMRSRCDQYADQVDRLKAEIKSLQESKLRSVEAEHWAPMSTSDIGRKLKTILGDVKRWSEQHATMPMPHIVAPSNFDRLARLLVSQKCTSTPGVLREKLEDNATMTKKPGKAAPLLMAALVSSILFRYVIAKPFVSFVGNDHENLLKRTHGNALDEVYNGLLWSDPEGAHAWRCQLLRLYSPPIVHSGTAAEQLKNISEASQKALAYDYASRLLHEVAGVLIPEESINASRSGLEEIVLAVSQLASSFWTRKQNIIAVDVERMTYEAGDPVVYRSSSDMLEVHPLHSIEVEDEPDALDEREVLLLCNPAIVAYGTHDGTDYHKYNIWKRAVVWLG